MDLRICLHIRPSMPHLLAAAVMYYFTSIIMRIGMELGLSFEVHLTELVAQRTLLHHTLEPIM